MILQLLLKILLSWIVKSILKKMPLGLESIRQYCDIDQKYWPLRYRKQSAPDDIVSLWFRLASYRARPPHCYLSSSIVLHSSHSRSAAKAYIVSPAETGRCLQQLSSTAVSSSSCLAPGLGCRLPDYTIRYRDTLAYDIAIKFFLTIRALNAMNITIDSYW